ncbi:DUF3710 domain-containing protein [Mycobacterium avium]|uniref:DUF3710 domain-containing protein n=8 Tax=Mycobacterium avium TaxID=1764 RepID=UPI0020C942A8|nr:DUF3710 domain-containing protein [Mycobacterium avium]
MAVFGRRARRGDDEDTPVGAEIPEPDPVVAHDDADEQAADELEGPFDIDDFDDPAVAELARLDLGSVLIPMPEAGQLQVELTETGVPSAVWVVTANGRFTIAAYAAPKTGGLWREVAAELAESLRNDSAKVSIQDGPWGREVVGTAAGVVRFIGVDGYRWMIRCVVNGTHETMEALEQEARAALADTVVRRGDTPLPVRTPLPVQLPEPMAQQLREAAAAQQAAAQQAQSQQSPGNEPAARRSADGSAMQQLRTVTLDQIGADPAALGAACLAALAEL